MPCPEMLALVQPHYSKGEMGRWTSCFRSYFLQQWFALTDPGLEDPLHEIAGAAPLCRH
jgi:IS5 family transposase